MSFKGRTVRVIMMTIEERKEKFIPLRAIRGTQRSIVTKNVTKVSNIVEDETLTTSVQVQHLEVVSRLTETKLSFLGDKTSREKHTMRRQVLEATRRAV